MLFDARSSQVSMDPVNLVTRASTVEHAHTRWAALVEPDPVHVLVFEDAIELAISPWENLERLRP